MFSNVPNYSSFIQCTVQVFFFLFSFSNFIPLKEQAAVDVI